MKIEYQSKLHSRKNMTIDFSWKKQKYWESLFEIETLLSVEKTLLKNKNKIFLIIKCISDR